MKEQLRQPVVGELLAEYAAREVPDDLDLWPRIHSGLQARSHRSDRPRLIPTLSLDWMFQGSITMKKGLALAGALALVIALGTVAFVPPVQAQFLRVVGVSAPAGVARMSETPIPGTSMRTLMVDPKTGETRTLYMGKSYETTRQAVSWDEARKAVDFPLRQPTYLPAGAKLARTELVTVPDADGKVRERGVVLFYTVGDSELALEQWPAFSAWPGTPPGARTVAVKGAPGWGVSDSNTILTWQTDKARYTLNGYLSQEEMLKVAESLAP